jgi:hypothetical protein
VKNLSPKILGNGEKKGRRDAMSLHPTPITPVPRMKLLQNSQTPAKSSLCFILQSIRKRLPLESSIFNDSLRGKLSVEFLNGDLKPGSREQL